MQLQTAFIEIEALIVFFPYAAFFFHNSRRRLIWQRKDPFKIDKMSFQSFSSLLVNERLEI